MAEYKVPMAVSEPYDVWPDPAGNIWISDGGMGGTLIRFDPKTETFAFYPTVQRGDLLMPRHDVSIQVGRIPGDVTEASHTQRIPLPACEPAESRNRRATRCRNNPPSARKPKCDRILRATNNSKGRDSKRSALSPSCDSCRQNDGISFRRSFARIPFRGRRNLNLSCSRLGCHRTGGTPAPQFCRIRPSAALIRPGRNCVEILVGPVRLILVSVSF